MLETEREYFDSKCGEWSESHKGEFALVKEDNLIGFFEEETEALAEGGRRFGDEDFLVRRIDGEHREKVRAPALTLGILRSSDDE